MKARIDDAATDIAAVGAWDAALQQDVLAKVSSKTYDAEAAEARLFLIRTGGDGGGPLDLYVDEEMPAQARRKVRRVGRKEHLLCVPSGRLMVGGVEDYRSSDPKITADDSVVAIPPGDYAVACFEARDPELSGFVHPTAEQIQAALGDEEYRYLQRVERIQLWNALHVLWFPALWLLIGWKWALGIALVIWAVVGNVQERWIARNARYQAAIQRRNEVIRQAKRGEDPTLILTLRRVTERGKLRGGSVHLEEEA